MSETSLTICIPSKGRLQENAFAFFAKAGLKVVQPRGARDYRGALEGIEGVEIAFLSASEIVGEIARGAVHLGITGADLVHESLSDPAAKVEFLLPLGFGHANVVVAVPEAWIDVQDISDLEDVAARLRAQHGRRLRVATKYINLTRRFFKTAGVVDYRIVESLGATEGAPAAGTADIIVDITTTGSTLQANALKVLDDGIILKSEAHLVASRSAEWTPRALEAAKRLLGRLEAQRKASRMRELRAFMEPGLQGDFKQALARLGGEVLLDGEAGFTSILVPEASVAEISDVLVEKGAVRVLVSTPHYAFGAENPVFDQLVAALT